MALHAIILSGGHGTRLWPTSRPERPKQFLPLMGPRSMFQSTVERMARATGDRAPIIVAGEGHADEILRQLKAIGDPEAVLLVEPAARDSAPAIAAAAAWIVRHDPDGHRRDGRLRPPSPRRRRLRRGRRHRRAGRGGRGHRHLRRAPLFAVGGLRLHPPGRAAQPRLGRPPRRALRREARRADRARLHRRRLPLEQRQLRLPRRHPARRAGPPRARGRPDRAGGRGGRGRRSGACTGWAPPSCRRPRSPSTTP